MRSSFKLPWIKIEYQLFLQKVWGCFFGDKNTIIESHSRLQLGLPQTLLNIQTKEQKDLLILWCWKLNIELEASLRAFWLMSSLYCSNNTSRLIYHPAPSSRTFTQIFHTPCPCTCCSIWLGVFPPIHSAWDTSAHLSVFSSKDIITSLQPSLIPEWSWMINT